MAKIVFFNFPATGHVNSSLPVISELVERGEDVVYVNAEKLRSEIEGTGARFVPYPDCIDMMARVDENIHDFPKAGLLLMRLSGKLMPGVTAIVEQEKPDLIIYDTLAVWGRMAAKKLNLPLVCFSSQFAFKPALMRIFPARAIALTSLRILRVFPKYMIAMLGIRLRHGVFPVLRMLRCRGNINIVFTSREFQPAGDEYDNSFYFVCPALKFCHFEGDFPFHQLRRDVSLVYISLGTIARNMEFYKTCFDAFEAYPAQFILSVGHQTNLDTLPPFPKNFIVRNFVPQSEILKRVDAVITHGGINTIQDALCLGLPMVVIPQQIEQALVGLQIRKFQAGILLRSTSASDKIDPLQLRWALERVLNEPKFRENAKMLGDGLRSAGGEKYAADVVQKFAGSII